MPTAATRAIRCGTCWPLSAATTARSRSSTTSTSPAWSPVGTGGSRTYYYDGFVESRSQPTLEVLGQVQRTRSLFGRADLDAARQHFMAKKSDAYRTLESSNVDAAGKQRIREYLDAFFAAIGSDDAFYRPAVVVEGERAYADASQANPLCSAMGPMPVGTVVSDPAETTDRMMRVALLDTKWNWATPKPCDAIHRGLVWIQRGAVSRDYPAVAAATR